jgi:hypothetical protein
MEVVGFFPSWAEEEVNRRHFEVQASHTEIHITLLGLDQDLDRLDPVGDHRIHPFSL